jgi:hypothetical protein
MSLLNPDGSPSRQAGAHPDLRTRITISRDPATKSPYSNVRDIEVELPAGFVGNANSIPQCPRYKLTAGGLGECPPDSQIGVALIEPDLEGPTAVYNMTPGPGEPALFGTNDFGTPVYITPSVRPGDYGVSAVSSLVSQGIAVSEADVTLWGVPADHLGGAVSRRVPFLTSSTSCSGSPDVTTFRADSWENPGVFTSVPVSGDFDGTPFVNDGCDKLAFNPSVMVAPLSRAAGTPTGLNVDLTVPQSESPDGLAAAHVKDVSVVFPAGMSVSPSAASGLGACSPDQIGLGTDSAVSCPASSRIGSVEIHTPLLADPLEGEVILAKQGDNPFGSLLAMYLAVKGPGFMLKLPGRVDADPVSGQLTATFDNNPQLPFDSLHLALRGGAQAPLVNPAVCGTYTTKAQLVSWSDKTVESDSSFAISEGESGAACPSGGFAPGFSAGSVSPQAGAFSAFTLTLSREDADQTLGGISLKMPPGLLGVLKSVVQCPEPQASSGACGPESLIGHTTVGAGAGSNPFYLGGNVYLTGPYKGAPFGLSVLVHALAGPFDLGNVIVRAAISVDPRTAQLSVVSDPLPTILQGIPLDLRTVNVTVDRSGFMFNPTSCDPMAVTGTVSSVQGTGVGVSSRFQAAGCAGLAFKPVLTASTQAKTSRANGASLAVKVTSGAGQANIRVVKFSLPKLLPSRLTTLQKACTAAVFDANPASCPVASNVGTATATTPVLAHALTGPAYLVSHGGAAFPDLVVILQGEGITLRLTGLTDIKKGVTSSTFNTVPDAPISSFELKLPTGPHSALAATLPAKAKGSLCGTSLLAPTVITAQNGAQIKQTTKIAVSGCPKAKKHKSTKKK